MHRLPVSLSDDLHNLLREHADRQNVPMSEVAREAISAWLAGRLRRADLEQLADLDRRLTQLEAAWGGNGGNGVGDA